MTRFACRSILATALADDLAAGTIDPARVDELAGACFERQASARTVELVAHGVRAEVAHRHQRLGQSTAAPTHMSGATR